MRAQSVPIMCSALVSGPSASSFCLPRLSTRTCPTTLHAISFCPSAGVALMLGGRSSHSVALPRLSFKSPCIEKSIPLTVSRARVGVASSSSGRNQKE